MSASKQDILGQLIMLRLDEPRWNASLAQWMRIDQPGGVLLSAPLPASPESTRELLYRIACTLPALPFLAVEAEGGTVDPLRAFFPPLPSPQAAALNGLSAVVRLGELVGEALGLLGFNTNFAPVLDLGSPLAEKTLGTRTFSSHAHHVARCGAAFVRGLQRHKILACAKYFPGLGGVPAKNSLGWSVGGKSMAELWQKDLVPYRELLPLLPLVMVSPAAYKAYDFDHHRPAVLSAQVVEGLLRTKLGYQGVAVACDLESEQVRGLLEVGEAAVQSVNAGCDLLLIHREKCVKGVVAGLQKAVESGRLSTQRLERALNRIQLLKKNLSPPKGKIPRGALERLACQFASLALECQSEEESIA